MFVIFDTETTGLTASRDRVVEIGAVKFRNDRILERRRWLINPGLPIPESATRIHGITSAMVTNAPAFAAVLPEFAAFAGEAVLLAHNGKFDRRFVAAELERNGLPGPTNMLVDTMPLFKRWYAGLRSYALEALVEKIVPAPTNNLAAAGSRDPGRDRTFHTALWDADCLAALFMKGAARLPPGSSLGDLLRSAGGVYFFDRPRRLKPPAAAPDHPASD